MVVSQYAVTALIDLHC